MARCLNGTSVEGHGEIHDIRKHLYLRPGTGVVYIHYSRVATPHPAGRLAERAPRQGPSIFPDWRRRGLASLCLWAPSAWSAARSAAPSRPLPPKSVQECPICRGHLARPFSKISRSTRALRGHSIHRRRRTRTFDSQVRQEDRLPPCFLSKKWRPKGRLEIYLLGRYHPPALRSTRMTRPLALPRSFECYHPTFIAARRVASRRLCIKSRRARG